MTARIGGTLAMALLAAGRARTEPGGVGLLARARGWIERAARGAHQSRR